MGPVGDCKLCSKNHYVDECVTGDIHYDATTGDVYIYNEKTWVLMSKAGTPLSSTYTSTSSGTGSGMHLHYDPTVTTTTHTGSHITTALPPREFPPRKEYDEFPTRLQFVTDEMNRHLPITVMSKSSTRCTCNKSEGNYSEHLAQVALDAADEWDQLLMAEEDAVA